VDKRFTDLLTSSLPLLGQQPVADGTRLRDVGLDSMQAVELLFGIEEVFGVTLPDESLDETTFETAGSLWQALRAAQDQVALDRKDG
jgi:acyl carrier protein